MPRTRSKAEAASAAAGVNGPPSEVLTLGEAAAYLRLSEDVVLGTIREQELPGRMVGTEWRFLKTALQDWLRTGPKGSTKDSWLAMAGAFGDDPDLEPIVEEAYRKRGRPITESGSYKNFGG
jgi:excisionase family DNA binding protein